MVGEKCICPYCIQAWKSHGEKLYVGNIKYEYDEAVELNIGCDLCGEADDLYEVIFE